MEAKTYGLRNRHSGLTPNRPDPKVPISRWGMTFTDRRIHVP